MANYISSNANRFYVAAEASFGTAAIVTSNNRFPAVILRAHQVLQAGKRMDKTGTRSYLGTPATSRHQTAFETKTYLTSWSGNGEPGYGPLFHAAMGGTPQISNGLTIAAFAPPTQLQTAAAHGLSAGSGVSFNGEIRFVAAVVDALTVILNAQFSQAPTVGTALATTITYNLATQLPSLTLYDYWSPTTAVSRAITGAAIDSLQFALNGDFHEFTFTGPAADLLDTSSFVASTAGLTAFPSEPALTSFDYSIVPGHLGQVWLGITPAQFFTLTGADIQLNNNIATRGQEFGSSYPRAIAPGFRRVSSSFELFAQDDAQTIALYQAAKARIPISAMLQLGQQQGQLMGIYMPNVTPEIPAYNDSETRLQWQFKNNLAQGTADDELVIAFA